MSIPKSILVAGLGISGFEASLLALDNSLKVIVIDTGDSTALRNRSACLTEKGASVICNFDLSKESLPFLPEKIVISPGIDPAGDFGQFLSKLGIKIISELEFAALFSQIPLIGVTGTNGKTTTVELITHCLKKLGKKAVACGNIGLAISKAVRENTKADYFVVEVSSFQLEAVEAIKFKAAAVLNISSDHVDRYDSFEDYGKTKLQILRHAHHKTISKQLLNDKWRIPSEPYRTTSIDGSNADICMKDGLIQTDKESFDYLSHPLEGIHNAENLMTAMSLLEHCGFSYKDVYAASLSFTPAPHRIQLISTHSGIKIYNDSKATNPHALLMALESLGVTDKRNIVLIAGGRDKKMDFKIVNRALCSYTKGIYLYGECRSVLYEVWGDKVPCTVCNSFSEAVQLSLRSVQPGEILLLSPGCSSLDSFKSYEERGNEFVKTVQEWTANEK